MKPSRSPRFQASTWASSTARTAARGSLVDGSAASDVRGTGEQQGDEGTPHASPSPASRMSITNSAAVATIATAHASAVAREPDERPGRRREVAGGAAEAVRHRQHGGGAEGDREQQRVKGVARHAQRADGREQAADERGRREREQRPRRHGPAVSDSLEARGVEHEHVAPERPQRHQQRQRQRRPGRAGSGACRRGWARASKKRLPSRGHHTLAA